MARWRLGVVLVLLLLIGPPIAASVGRLVADPAAWLAWTDAPRLLALAGNTVAVLTLTLALSLPVGILLAVLLYRTDLPLRRLLRFVLLLTLFVPLPLFAVGWQAVLADATLLGVLGPQVQGMGAAAGLHAAAALPWIVLLVGQGLRWVERDLEEDALTAAPPWRVLLRVTLPRAGAAVAAAALWVAVQVASEITITDLFQIRTLAEEVYTQFVLPEGDNMEARALAVALPVVLLAAVLVVWAGDR